MNKTVTGLSFPFSTAAAEKPEALAGRLFLKAVSGLAARLDSSGLR